MVEGIDEGKMMKGAHWRKKWPEGVTDDGEGDDEASVLFDFNNDGHRRKKVYENPVKPDPTYPWSYD